MRRIRREYHEDDTVFIAITNPLHVEDNMDCTLRLCRTNSWCSLSILSLIPSFSRREVFPRVYSPVMTPASVLGNLNTFKLAQQTKCWGCERQFCVVKWSRLRKVGWELREAYDQNGLHTSDSLIHLNATTIGEFITLMMFDILRNCIWRRKSDFDGEKAMKGELRFWGRWELVTKYQCDSYAQGDFSWKLYTFSASTSLLPSGTSQSIWLVSRLNTARCIRLLLSK